MWGVWEEMTYAQCPLALSEAVLRRSSRRVGMPNAQCPMPNAQFNHHLRFQLTNLPAAVAAVKNSRIDVNIPQQL